MLNTVSPRAERPYDKIGKICDSALTLDAHYYNAGATPAVVASYKKDNSFQYRIAITSWLMLISSFDVKAAWDVRGLIEHHGLSKVIDMSNFAANAMIRSEPVPRPWCYMHGPLKQKLQACRYLKRFTPIGIDALDEASYRTFLDVQERLWKWKQEGQYLRGSSLIKDIKNEVSSLITPFDAVPDFSRFSPGSTLGWGPSLPAKADGVISSDPDAFRRGAEGTIPLWGEVLDKVPNGTGKGKMALKKRAIAQCCLYEEAHRYAPLGVLVSPGSAWERTAYYVPNPTRELRENAMGAVPKSYKASRLIAPETPIRQWNASRLATALERHFTDVARLCIPLHDQAVNQEGARIGSLAEHKYATIDQSSASDSISEDLFRMVFPDWYVSFFDELDVRSTHTYIGGDVTTRYTRSSPDGADMTYTLKGVGKDNVTRIRLMTHLTSGNSLTFIHESLLFCAIARVATRYASYWICGEDEAERYVDSVREYGDDTVIIDFAAETFMDILSILGFKPNRDKSFYGEIPFRESCGAEFWDGEPIHSTYWPRKAIKSEQGSLSSLISLQHRMSAYEDITEYLASVCRGIVPALTSHDPCTECSDLWEERPQYTYVLAPIDKRRTPKRFMRELGLKVEQANLYGTLVYLGTVPADLAYILRFPKGSKEVSEEEFESTYTPIPWEAFIREEHTILTPRYPSVEGAKGFKGNIGVYCMRLFLEEGPYYIDPLMETLHVSSPRWDASQLAKYHEASDLFYKVVTRTE